MSELKILYKKLKKYHKGFKDWDNVNKFVQTVEEIVDKNDSTSIPILFKYFDDEDYTDYVYERLKSLIASYGKELYTEGVLQNLHVLLPNAKGWAMEMLYGILNNKECFKIFKNNLHLAKKEHLEELFDMIYEESEEHRAVIHELREILKER